MIEEINNLLANHYTWLFSGLGVAVLLAPLHLLRLMRIGKNAPVAGQYAEGLFSLNIAKSNPLGQIAHGVFSSNIGFHVGNQRCQMGIINIAHTVGYPRRKLSKQDYTDFLHMTKKTGIALILVSPCILAISFGLWHLGYASRYNILMLLPVTFLFVFSLGCCFHGLVLVLLSRETKIRRERNKSDAPDKK